MEQANKEQNGVIFSISEILCKMSNQVNFLIRNHKLLSQLDVDMLMENTRKLYDTICSVRCNMDVDAIPMEIENEKPTFEEKAFEEDTFENSEENDFEEEADDFDNEDFQDFEDDNYEDVENDKNENEDVEIENEMSEENEDVVCDDVDEIVDDELAVEKEIITFDSEPDPIKDDNEEDSGIRSYIKTPSAETSYTIGDKLEKEEDNSLAYVLQKKPIVDLMTAIDLNDRFLFLNELFNSNMEKYNKSIRALNGFSTLLGAKTYMSELQIEFQWDCKSEAYKKLADLVERRFISMHNS